MLRRLITSSVRAPVARTVATRSFSVVAARRGEDHHDKPKELFLGPGAKPGTVPTDLEQATGLERLELLAKLEGRELFDMAPLEMNRLGTKADPIIVKAHGGERMIGCTGYGIESHETLWLKISHEHEFDRCPECGSVFKHQFI